MKNRATMLNRQVTIAAFAVGALLLTGCAGQPAGEQPAAGDGAAAPAQTSSPPSDAPTPAVPDLEDPSSWVIDYAAIGPVALDSPVSDQAASLASFTSATQDACPSVAAFDKADFPSIWLPDPTGAGIVDQIVLQAWGTVAAATAHSPQTSEGIGIGATLDQLTAAYPDLSESAGKYAPVYSVTDDGAHWINFALSDAGLVDTIVVRDTAAIDSEYCG